MQCDDDIITPDRSLCPGVAHITASSHVYTDRLYGSNHTDNKYYTIHMLLYDNNIDDTCYFILYRAQFNLILRETKEIASFFLLKKKGTYSWIPKSPS